MTPFAQTKIQRPRWRADQQIERPALQSALAEATASHRVVLLCAPAGFGKTATLAALATCQPAGHALAWVSLDDDDDLPRLLQCLIAALEPFDPPWRTAPEALVALADADGPRSALTAEFVNTLAACDTPHGLIVLDDLHRIHDAGTLDFVAQLSDRLSPHWTLVLGTRADPPLPLPRLRARGELAEFRQPQLLFSLDETRALVQRLGHDAALAEVLHQRTEGWPAGLRLALNALGRGHGLRSGLIDRHLFEFLATEVLDQLRPELHQFLLQASVLGELDAQRCAAVCDHPQPALMLDEVARLGLFTTELPSTDDHPGPCLRLNDLFRQTLTRHLMLSQPDAAARLLQRAASAEPDDQRRIGLLLQAGALPQAADELLRHGARWITQGAPGTVQRLADQFPPTLRASSATLLLVDTQLAWSRWDFNAMATLAQQAADAATASGQTALGQLARAYLAIALNAQGRIDDCAQVLSPLRREPLDDEARVLMLVASSWTALDMGALHRVGPVLNELVAVLERTPRIELWFQATPLPRFSGLPDTADALQRMADGVLALAGDSATPLRAGAWLSLGWQAIWQGRLDEAAQLLQRAADDCRWTGNPVNIQRLMHHQQAVLLALRGQREAALQAALPATQRAPGHSGDWALWQSLMLSARVAVICDDAALLRHCMQRMAPLQLARRPLDAAVRGRPQLTLPGHLAWLEGRPDEAITLWRDALRHEEQIDVLGQAHELRVRLAAALCDIGRDAEACEVLAPLASPATLRHGPGGALFARSALLRLVPVAAQQRLTPPLAAQVARWAAMLGLGASDLPAGTAPTGAVVTGAATTGVATDASTGDSTDLSPREREVLARIAQGDSNKLIARAFDLSPHTVKRHVANVLGKLGVASRGQAAAWWRDHLHGHRRNDGP